MCTLGVIYTRILILQFQKSNVAYVMFLFCFLSRYTYNNLQQLTYVELNIMYGVCENSWEFPTLTQFRYRVPIMCQYNEWA